MSQSETTIAGKGGRQTSSQYTGNIFSVPGLLVLMAVFLFAIWYSQLAIAILVGLIISAATLARLWSRFSLARVNCQRILAEQRVFPGEHINVSLQLKNCKPLPLPWIQVDDVVPHGLALEGKTEGSAVQKRASLLWYTGISWRYKIHALRRGFFSLGSLTVSSGDIFGFYPRFATLPAEDSVIVYPKLLRVREFNLPPVFPLGEVKAERRIFEDSTRSVGVRDYSPGDSFRHIHWKASARNQVLQIKVFEPTTTLKTVIFLGVDTFPAYWTNPEEDFELGVSAAASIANYVIQKRSPVGLFVNCCQADSGEPVRIPAANGTNQLVKMLEALAKTTLKPGCSFDEFLQHERDDLSWGTTVILMISRPSPSLLETMGSLKEAGHKPLVVQFGNSNGDAIARGVDWYNIKCSDDAIDFIPRGMR